MQDDPAYAGTPLSDAPKPWMRFADKLDRLRYRIARRWPRNSRRRQHLAIVDFDTARVTFSDRHARWINARSERFSACVTQRPERADVIWVHVQDPMSAESRARTDAVLAESRGVPIINQPNRYNFYHEPGSFQKLAAAGVSVPVEILPGDNYSGLAVYKQANTQVSPKSLEPYDGPREGYRAFSYLDFRDGDGAFRRYRVFYLCGWIRASKLFVSRHWNVSGGSCERLFYGFHLTPKMRDSVGKIAEVSGLDFFAVDMLVRAEDDEPFFVDINTYPRINSLRSTQIAAGALVVPHTFDARRVLGMPEPDGIDPGVAFDLAVTRWREKVLEG